MAAKPVGSRCNIDCAYCYYLHKQTLLAEKSAAPMSGRILEEFIRQFIAGQDTDTVEFSWHGGEPTMLGLEFFQKIVELQQKHAGTKRIENDLQTNGLLLDDEWCRFLHEHRFLVGLSIDGPKDLHDRFRVTRGGAPTFDDVMTAARRLQEYDVAFNTLTVVHAGNARHPTEVYQFLTRELGCQHIQFSPCVETKDFRTTAPGYWGKAEMPEIGSQAAKPGNPSSIVTDWSVDPDDFGEFLCQTFDFWYQNDVGNVLVNWFESVISLWSNNRAQLCTMAEVCGRAVAMEKDGGIYSCDHFVYPEYRLGYLSDSGPTLAEMVYSPEQRKFGCNKRDTLTNYCKNCSCLFTCNGDCPKNRFIKTPDGESGLSYLCSGLKRFLTHADPYVRQIVSQIQSRANLSDADTASERIVNVPRTPS